MRRITLWMLSTITVLVLLFSYRTSTSSAATTTVAASAANGSRASSGSAASSDGAASAAAGSSGTDSGSSSSDSGSSSSDSGSSSGSGSSSSGSSSSSSGQQTVTGDAIGTRYGDVQVQIVVADGKIISSKVTQVPWNDRRDQEINAYAVPILNAEAVSAQSSSIDMVSGATFTSDGYIQSLQSAIDQAGL